MTQSGEAEATAHGTASNLFRALAALAIIAVILAGVPAVLLRLTPTLPVGLRQWSLAALLRPDDGSLLLTLLLAIAWMAWGVLTVALTMEIGAALRRTPTPRLPGLGAVQRLAATLVAAVAVATSPVPAHAAHAAPLISSQQTARDDVGLLAPARTHIGGQIASDMAPALTLPNQGSTATEPTASAAGETRHPTVKVRRHDTLWLLAEQYLGAGKRYSEIVGLNKGRRQPDGRVLRDDGRLRVGWHLELPPDADLSAQRPRRLEVHRGDTMWDLSAEHLGDARRYPEILELNAGDRQPDGSELSDADVIQPGWVLELPAPTDPPAPATAPDPDDSPDNDAAAESHDALPELERDGGAAETHDSASAPAPTAEATPAAAAHPELASVISLPEGEGPGAGILLPAGGFLTGLLAADFLRRLSRRRQTFVRHRQPGQYPSDPGGPAREVEQAAATSADPTPGDLLDRALTQLAANAGLLRRTLPDVQVVKTSDAEVTLHLAAPEPTALAPFVRLNRRTWQLDFSQLAADSPEYACPYPALIPVGSNGARLVLVNLESAGTLLITGDPGQVADVMRALRSELAWGPVRTGTSRTLCLASPASSAAYEQDLGTDPGELVIEPHAQRADAALAHHLRMCAVAVKKLGLGDTRGFVDEDPLAAPIPEIVLTDQELNVLPGRWSGGAVITSVPTDRARMTLTVAADGQAHLQPGNHQLSAQRLSPASGAGMVACLAAPERPANRRQIAADAGMIDLREFRSGGSATPALPHSNAPAATELVADPTPAGPRLLLLGELGIAGAVGNISEPSRITRLAEAAVYILLNPDCRPSQLADAMWPGQRPNPNTCRQLISRLRSLLGRDDAGEPYLLPLAVTGGRLRLADSVTSDWAQFQRFASQGLADDCDLTALRLALGLVRGRPFGPVSGRELPWADLAVTEMVCLISDVAHELHSRLTTAGDHAGARDAALQGLRTQSEADVLLDDAIAASRRLGDQPKVAQLQRRRAALDE